MCIKDKLQNCHVEKTKFSSPRKVSKNNSCQNFERFSFVSKLGLRFTLEYFALLLYSCLICKWYVALNHRFIINFQIDTNWRELLPFSTPPHRTHQFEFVRQSMFKVDIGLGPKLENWSLNIWHRNHSRKFTHLMAHRTATKCDWQLPSLIKRSSIKEKKVFSALLLDFQPIQFQEFVPQNPQNYSKCRIWSFEFWHFPSIFVLLKLTCLVTLFDRKL